MLVVCRRPLVLGLIRLLENPQLVLAQIVWDVHERYFQKSSLLSFSCEEKPECELAGHSPWLKSSNSFSSMSKDGDLNMSASNRIRCAIRCHTEGISRSSNLAAIVSLPKFDANLPANLWKPKTLVDPKFSEFPFSQRKQSVILR